MDLVDIVILFITILILPIYVYFIVMFAYMGKMTAIRYVIKYNRKGDKKDGEKEKEEK